ANRINAIGKNSVSGAAFFRAAFLTERLCFEWTVFLSGGDGLSGYRLTGFGCRRPNRKPFTKPEVLIVDRGLVKQAAIIFVVSKSDAFYLHKLIVFPRFFQNQRQPRPDSPISLPDEPDGSGMKTIKRGQKFSFCFLRHGDFYHDFSRCCFRH
ncbi:MAG TPA: hypothetical protein PK090_03385, partial [Smithellaceae bacterium]|nr:hypothetical protein [Smithellaceae bacterium]